MEPDLPTADQLKAELKREVFPPHSAWWTVSRWLLRVALAFTLMILVVIVLVLAVQLRSNNADARCRSQVVYSMLSAQNRLVDALSTMPRDQPRIDNAVLNLHGVEEEVRHLVDAHSCGYKGDIIPQPGGPANP